MLVKCTVYDDLNNSKSIEYDYTFVTKTCVNGFQVYQA